MLYLKAPSFQPCMNPLKGWRLCECLQSLCVKEWLWNRLVCVWWVKQGWCWDINGWHSAPRVSWVFLNKSAGTPCRSQDKCALTSFWWEVWDLVASQLTRLGLRDESAKNLHKCGHCQDIRCLPKAEMRGKSKHVPSLRIMVWRLTCSWLKQGIVQTALWVFI